MRTFLATLFLVTVVVGALPNLHFMAFQNQHFKHHPGRHEIKSHDNDNRTSIVNYVRQFEINDNLVPGHRYLQAMQAPSNVVFRCFNGDRQRYFFGK
jgi:hypothetical protein